VTARRRLLIVADVGGRNARHIGDEAMLEANLDGLRRVAPGAELVVMSRDPEWISEQYGVISVPLFGFPEGTAAHEERVGLMKRLCDAAGSGAEAGEPLDAVRSADAVVVSGGGNLSSTWPHLLAERVALLLTAQRLGKPAVVLGQTIGPNLTREESALLSEALRTARFVGVRELPSAALALALGVPLSRLWYQCDDAMFVGRDGAIAVNAEAAAQPVIAVTIDPQFRSRRSDGFPILAAQLRELALSTGASIVLVPHEFGSEAQVALTDMTEARLLADAIGLPGIEIAGDLDARTAARIAANSALVVSSRYHPLVFALAEGTSCIGIFGDEYCRIKLQGALVHAGLERYAIHFDDVADGALLPLALESWRNRERMRRDLARLRERWNDETLRRWNAIGRSLDAEPPADAPSGTIMGRTGDELVPLLLAAIELARDETARDREAAARGREAAARGREAASRGHEAEARWRQEEARHLETIERLRAKCEETERIAIDLETMARPWLALRRHVSKLRASLRRLAGR